MCVHVCLQCTSKTGKGSPRATIDEIAIYNVVELGKGGGSIFLVVRQRILWKLMACLRAAKFSNLILFMTMTSSQSAMHESSSKVTGMLSLPTSA